MHNRSSANGQWSKEAIERLWREHRPWVAALLYAHLPGGSRGAIDVNDLLQEVAISLVANINRLTAPEKIGPWLRTVAMNIARDAGRRQLVRKNTVNAGDHLDDMAELHRRESAGELRDVKERGRRALDIVMTLPAEYREPLLLNLRGLSHKQIAIVCELPMSTIETRVFRARVMVRNELEASEGRVRKNGSEDRQSRKRLKVSSEP